MRCTNTSTPINIYYKTDALASGQSVSFDVWDGSGTSIESGTPADAEVDTDGVYYLSIVTPASDAYLLIKGTDGSKPQGTVIKVGVPPIEKGFHIDKDFTPNLTIPYDIWDDTGGSLASGNLTWVADGFYTTSVDGLATPWFFEVHPLSIKDQPCSDID